MKEISWFGSAGSVFTNTSERSWCAQVPYGVLQDSALVARHIHFGSSVAAICRGMHQREVSRLFTRECLCVRAYDPDTGACLGGCSNQVMSDARRDHTALGWRRLATTGSGFGLDAVSRCTRDHVGKELA